MKSPCPNILMTGATLLCAALAGLGIFHRLGQLSGHVLSGSLFALAGLTAWRGIEFFPRAWGKRQKRLLVKRETQTAGSLTLFAMAAILLAVLVSTCRPAASQVNTDQVNTDQVNVDFLHGKEQTAANPSSRSGVCGHGAHSCHASAETKQLPRTSPRPGACLEPWGAVVALLKPRWRMCAGRNHRPI